MTPRRVPHPVSRRAFLRATGGAALLGGGVLLGACSSDDGGQAAAPSRTTPPPEPTTVPTPSPDASEGGAQGAAIVGDVLDFSIRPQDWAGAFGFVRMRLHRALVDGEEVFFVRTDASDETYATDNELVFVPKLAGLADGVAGSMYTFDDGVADQAPVLSTEPGRDDYSPAWQVRQVAFTGEPVLLGSVAEVEAAVADGSVAVTDTPVVVNAGIVRWSSGEMPVDGELAAYLGGGQLIEAPDVAAMTVTFKLHQCYPSSWYFPLDHSLAGPAEATNTVHSPGLQAVASDAGATGVTNVFANGLEGPGPMGAQPSAFDFAAGSARWSPYWDHFTYEWAEGSTPRLLTTMDEIHTARDAGELIEYPGAPPTDGTVFTVNCPVPVLGPELWTPPAS